MTKEQKKYLRLAEEQLFTPRKYVFYVSELMMKEFERIYKNDKLKKVYKKK